MLGVRISVSATANHDSLPLMDVRPGGCAQSEHRRPDESGEAQVETPKGGKVPHHGKPRLAVPTSNWNGLSGQPM